MSVSNQTGWPSVPVAETAVACGTRMGAAGLADVGVKVEVRHRRQGRKRLHADQLDELLVQADLVEQVAHRLAHEGEDLQYSPVPGSLSFQSVHSGV